MEYMCGQSSFQKGLTSRSSGAKTFGFNPKWSGLQNLVKPSVCLQSLELFDFLHPQTLLQWWCSFEISTIALATTMLSKQIWHDCQNYENKTQVVINLNYAVHSWELVITELCRSCHFGETKKKKKVGNELLYVPPQDKTQCNVASRWTANMAEVTHNKSGAQAR